MKYSDFLTEKKVQDELESIKQAAIAADTFMLAPNGKKTNLQERQWLSVRTKAFKNWFGDWEHDKKNASKAVDDNGEPLVCYHGSDASFTKFDPKLSGSHGHDFGKLIFFTNDSHVASGYSIRFKKSKEFMAQVKLHDELRSQLASIVKQHGTQSDEFNDFKKNVWDVRSKEILGDKLEIERAIENFELITPDATVYSGYLDIKNPLVVDGKGESWLNVHEDTFEKFQNGKYDGVIIKNVIDTAVGDKKPCIVFAFSKPNQVKSAIGNKGTYKKDSDELHEHMGE